MVQTYVNQSVHGSMQARARETKLNRLTFTEPTFWSKEEVKEE